MSKYNILSLFISKDFNSRFYFFFLFLLDLKTYHVIFPLGVENLPPSSSSSTLSSTVSFTLKRFAAVRTFFGFLSRVFLYVFSIQVSDSMLLFPFFLSWCLLVFHRHRVNMNNYFRYNCIRHLHTFDEIFEFSLTLLFLLIFTKMFIISHI